MEAEKNPQTLLGEYQRQVSRVSRLDSNPLFHQLKTGPKTGATHWYVGDSASLQAMPKCTALAKTAPKKCERGTAGAEELIR